MDTGMFKAVTDEFIAESFRHTSSVPPVAEFPKSEALQNLSKVQNEAREHLKNILLLTAPPKIEE